MRRGLGVAHIQQQRQTQAQMADLGAQITAQRVSQIADQLESLESQLRVLAEKHKGEIKHDPVVRARFRQLADSLGVDLISSKKNVFAGVLGLGDFYYSLAGKVVEACMSERKFCGSYVPLRRVVQCVQKSYSSAAVSSDRDVTISEEDILTALKKLHCLGDGYSLVRLGDVKYIQTTPDGAKGADEIPLINFVLQEQKKKIAQAKASQQRQHASSQSTTSKTAVTATPPASQADRMSHIGAAYVLGAHPLANDEQSDSVLDAVSLPFEAQCVGLTERQICDGLLWPAHRTHATLQRLVQDGSVWVSYAGMDSNSKEGPVKALQATENKEVWRSTKNKTKVVDDGIVYWFVSLTSFADV